MYIRIRNKQDKVNRAYLEKLGLSDKRDDPNKIGQFGSGSKFAPIFALRRGWEWISCCQDDDGEYQMSFTYENENGINSIYFDYGNGVRKSSSFVLEAGSLSWDNPFQIFREAYSNALDGEDCELDIVDKIDWEPGYFDVYITAAPELMEIVDNLDSYFTTHRKPKGKIGGQTFYNPVNDEMRVYCKDVLVYHDDSTPAIFDYQFDGIKLNEDRMVKNSYDMEVLIVEMISSVNNSYESEMFIRSFINCMHRKYYEWTIDTYRLWNVPERWLEIFKEIKGENAILVPEELATHKHSFDMQGLKPIFTSNNFMVEVMLKAGQRPVEDILGADFEYDIMPVEGELATMMARVDEIMESHGMSPLTHYDIFYPRNGQEGIKGLCLNNGKILLSKRTFDNGIHDVLGTVIHELDHRTTGYRDGDREFRNIADERIADLMIDNYSKTLEFSHDGIHIPKDMINQMDGLNYEVIDCGKFSILDVGGVHFKITESINAERGSIVIDNGRMIIPIVLSISTTVREI